MQAKRGHARIGLDELNAIIFDMDGVLTEAATLHAQAWKRMFDEYLEKRARRTGETFEPFDADKDYTLFVDGKPRFDGVRSFLESRGISVPEGTREDSPDRETVFGLGNRKNNYFLSLLEEKGAKTYKPAIDLIKNLRRQGVRTAVVSSSRNAERVLKAAGILALFDVEVDGVDIAELGIQGKPHPAIHLEAARRLGVEPGRAAVVEDAISGVEAGRRGDFVLVVGVARGDHGQYLKQRGADIVVHDLSELQNWLSPESRRGDNRRTRQERGESARHKGA